MDSFNPGSFFNFKKFAYNVFFNQSNTVWEALINLKNFFDDKKSGTILSKVPSNVYLENPESIYIGENTLIEPGTFIKGPCIIGNNCEIRFGAYIRGFVVTGNNCIIGHDTEIKNAILLDGARAAHFAYVGDSILGNNVNLGAGVKLANFRLDKQPIKFSHKDILYKTGLAKFGAIIGDNTQIGCNVVLNPGTFIGPDSIAYAGLNFGGVFPSKTIIKASPKLVIKRSRRR
ncbi:MAG: UDP-N-acetylglucosamine diphosphorylase [Chlamydiae bacterium]|nr:UDP-N-acetylglucosamine diphosphorylase [Chlamydiota bacterium]